MTTAPDRLRTVEAPRAFYASSLAVVEACPLRAVAGRAVLPSSGDAAEVGKWLHEFADEGGLAALSWDDGLRRLDAFLTVRGASLSGPPAGWSPFDWLEACHRALRHAREAPPGSVRSPKLRREDPEHAGVRGPQRADERAWLAWEGTRTELPLYDEVLRVSGRVDRVTFEPDRVVIVDLKTGGGVGRDGQPTRAARLQLAAYGAYVRRVRPGAEVVLVVVGGRRATWTCDAACAAEAEAVLYAAGALMPAGALVPAPRLARPGVACLFCSQRPVCPGYPAASDAWRRSGADHAFPDDVCGTVVAKVPVIDGLDVVSDDGVRYRLRDVPESVRRDVGIGVRLETYGRGRSTRVGGGQRLPLTLDGAARTYYVSRRGAVSASTPRR